MAGIRALRSCSSGRPTHSVDVASWRSSAGSRLESWQPGDGNEVFLGRVCGGRWRVPLHLEVQSSIVLVESLPSNTEFRQVSKTNCFSSSNVSHTNIFHIHHIVD